MSNSGRKQTWIIFAGLVCCWLPYIVLCFPGNIAYDSGTAIAWYTGLDRSNPNNPYFLNFLMGFFYSLGGEWNHYLLGIALYCLLQAFLTAYLLSRMLSWMQARIRAKKAVWILAAVYALVPAFPLYAFTMVKDSIFALAILFYEYLTLRALSDPDRFWESRWNCILYAAAIVLTGLARNYAGYLPAAAFLIYALHTRRGRIVITACSTAAGVLFFTLLLPRLLGIPAAESRETLSVPIQMTAGVIQEHPEDVSAEERETLTAVLPWEDWTQRYQPDLADPLKDAARLDRETTGPFLRTWAGMAWRHPGTALRAWTRMTDGYFLPWAQTKVKDHAVIGNRMNKDVLRALKLNRWGNPLTENARTVDEWFLNIPGVGWLAKIGLYSWLLIGLTVFVLIRVKGRYLLCLAPLLMVLAGCVFSPVNGYYRYAFPYILSVPPVLLLIAGNPECRRRGKGKADLPPDNGEIREDIHG